MNRWIADFITAQKAALDSVPAEAVAELIETFQAALADDRQIFVFGNGGSAANASHFVTDLGKGASDKIGRRFRVMALNDNISWMTAIANDYAYDEIFVRQLMNFGRSGDVGARAQVSGGDSPNVGESDGLGGQERTAYDCLGGWQARAHGGSGASMHRD